ncbi:hypothetical protein KM043_014487 [Ampulex compressa]|nr:hypothetical protein KM043_014487 [Ampulex compressa]
MDCKRSKHEYLWNEEKKNVEAEGEKLRECTKRLKNTNSFWNGEKKSFSEQSKRLAEKESANARFCKSLAETKIVRLPQHDRKTILAVETRIWKWLTSDKGPEEDAGSNGEKLSCEDDSWPTF